MASFSAPIQHGDTEGTLGYAAVFASARMEMDLVEKLDAESLGLITAVGDLAGSGSDTINLTHIDGVGFAESLPAMSAETEEIPVTGFDAANDTVTVGRYGLAKSESFTSTILGRVAEAKLEALMAKIPDSLARTIMEQLCSKFTSVSGSAGASGSAWSYNAELDLLALLNETEGFEGLAHAVRQPEQFTDLYESMRNEPGLQTPAVMAALLRLRTSGTAEAVMGFRNVSSHRVNQSSGDHIGCAYAPGAFVVARASTASLAGKVPGAEVIVPRLGLYISRDTTAKQGKSRFDAQSWLGLAQRAVAVAPAFRIISVDN